MANTAPYALFSQEEDTRGYLTLLQGVIESKGIPLAVYTDGHAVFANRMDFQEIVWEGKGGKLTQCSRALGELGVTRIAAHSPEPKGRYERPNANYQDRILTENRQKGASTMSEANEVLAAFLPRFNQRFCVPADDMEVAYRPLEPETDLAGVLCIKEQRRVARDNTVQYKNTTLQLFPGMERTSYAGSRVEVQERLDGRVLVKCGEEVLTPQQAPPLAAELRSYISAPPVGPFELDPRPQRQRVPKPAGPLAGGTVWYEDTERKDLHSKLVREGMERARQDGKRIGRPKVSENPGFEDNFNAVVELIDDGTLSRRKASVRLGIGYATLKRLLDAREASGSDQS